MDELKLIGERNAEIWAQQWLETIEENPTVPHDKGAMLAWFASAIETGFGLGIKMEKLNKIETAAALVAIRAVINSGPGVHDDHPLKTAEEKLAKNLEEYNAA